MNLNNIYNFKNPVKHFINIDELAFPQDIQNFNLDKLVWTEPIKFRIRKDEEKYRVLKLPNILNLVAAYYHYKDMPYFDDIQCLDIQHKRLSANIDTGDFSGGEYDRQLERDFNNLCIYDNLIRLDVKEYYGRIYTHNIDFNGHGERYLSNMNCGETNGLLMGNYISLYFAESILSKISVSIENMLMEQNIDCIFSYFSDDFYFFCNKEDNDGIISIFDKVLEQFDLERSDKKEIWTYETFNNHNVVARYWKKVVAHCNTHFNNEKTDNKLCFINQMVYRMSKLDDYKLKKVFINNLFKIKYFRELPLGKFQVKEYDYHQLCFLLKYSPESMLYAADRFAEMQNFDKNKLTQFFKVRYKECLRNNYNEEQLYYFYAISVFGFNEILQEYSGAVAKSCNQILISYYLKDHLFKEEEINYLRTCTQESYWLQNYHLILYSPDLMSDLEESIEKYLIPQKIKRALCTKVRMQNQRITYLEFYKENLSQNKAIIRDIDMVKEEILEYLELKIQESEEMFELEEDE